MFNDVIKLKESSSHLLSWQLNDRQICDLELLLNGAFNPLKGFMDKDDYNSVRDNMRLANGDLWPIPINLDVTENFSEQINFGDKIVLRDKEGFPLAILTISDIWKPNLLLEAELVYGTKDINHPGVNYLLNSTNKFYVGGTLNGISYPRHYDYLKFRHSP